MKCNSEMLIKWNYLENYAASCTSSSWGNFKKVNGTMCSLTLHPYALTNLAGILQGKIK